ncbi:hypothetical protein ACOMHN_036809 [Nucella lapillus]
MMAARCGDGLWTLCPLVLLVLPAAGASSTNGRETNTATLFHLKGSNLAHDYPNEAAHRSETLAVLCRRRLNAMMAGKLCERVLQILPVFLVFVFKSAVVGTINGMETNSTALFHLKGSNLAHDYPNEAAHRSETLAVLCRRRLNAMMAGKLCERVLQILPVFLVFVFKSAVVGTRNGKRCRHQLDTDAREAQ